MIPMMTSSDKPFKKAICIAAGAVLSYKIYRIYNENQKSNTFQPIGLVSEIFTHPLKGGRGLINKSATINSAGVLSGNEYFKVLDRSFAIINIKLNKSVDSRQHPNIVKIISKPISKNEIEFSALGYESIIVKPDYSIPLINNVHVINRETNGLVDCGDEAANWFDNYINSIDSDGEVVKHRVCFYDEKCSSGTVKNFVQSRFDNINKIAPQKSDYEGTLNDDCQYMIASTQTLSHLNDNLTKLGKQVTTSRNFRGNFTINCFSNKPNQENTWEEVYIGENNSSIILKSVMKCTRCPFINLDPESGISRKDEMPLEWLKQFSATEDNETSFYGKKKAVFGAYFSSLLVNKGKTCEIKLGDVVYAKMKK